MDLPGFGFQRDDLAEKGHKHLFGMVGGGLTQDFAAFGLQRCAERERAIPMLFEAVAGRSFLVELGDLEPRGPVALNPRAAMGIAIIRRYLSACGIAVPQSYLTAYRADMAEPSSALTDPFL